MASNIFEKNKLKMQAKHQIEDAPKAMYKLYKEPEGAWNLTVGLEDVSERLKFSELEDGEWLAFDPEQSAFYLLPADNQMELNVAIEVPSIKSTDQMALVFYDHMESYYMIHGVEHIAEDTISVGFENQFHLIWNPNDESYYQVFYKHSLNRQRLYPAYKSDIQGGLLWFKTEDSFYLFDRGINISANTNSVMNGDDVILFNTETKDWYIFKDFNSTPDFVVKEVDKLETDEKTLWFRPNPKQYRMVKKGRDIVAEDWTNVRAGNHLVVYRPEKKTHYILRNFFNAELNALYFPVSIKTKNTAIVCKLPDNQYMLIKNGQAMKDTLAKKLENSLFILHQATNNVYSLNNYHAADDYEFVAVLPQSGSEVPELVNFIRSV